MGSVVPFRRPEPETAPERARRRRAAGKVRPRDLGVSPRQLGVAPRQLGYNPKAGQLPKATSRPTVAVQRHAGMPGCPRCGGTGWAEAGAAVEPCPCRDGEVLAE
jgi:hypothetical protein